MKLHKIFYFLLPALVFSAVSAAEKKSVCREIAFSAKEPVSHLKDIQYFANPKFTPAPVWMSRKAFKKDPLIDFTLNTAWKARLYDCNGFLCLSKDQMIGERPNLKLELTSGELGCRAELIPVKPVKAAKAFDTFELLAYAKNIAVITVKFRLPGGKLFVWRSGRPMNDKLTGWNILRGNLHRTLPAGTALESIGFQTVNFRTNRKPDIWHLEQFDVVMKRDHFKEKPLKFNTGKIVQIPVSPEGSRPVPAEKVTARVWREGRAFKLRYENRQGRGVTYVYTPGKGTLADISVCGDAAKPFSPAAGSGPVFEFKGKTYDILKAGAVKATLLKCELKNNIVTAVWRYSFGNTAQEITWRLQIRGKTLVTDLDSAQRLLKEWRPGYALGTAADAKIFDVPFMNHTPKILWNSGLFFSHFHDHYKGNFSSHGYDAVNKVSPGKAEYHFVQLGYAYQTRSDGSRHPFRETVYMTAARKFEEVLLTPSNPKSPYKEMLSNNLYKKFEVRSQLYQKAKKLTDLYDRYGVNHVFFDVFSFIWASGFWGGSESSFHTDKTAYIHEKDGGDEGFRKMLKDVADKQMVPGYYETYNAMQVKSSQWDPQKVTIRPDGTWNAANDQAYMHKMWAFPDWEQEYFKKRHQKFQPRRTGYVDGFTSRLPFMYNDYDHRYPEAGKMIDTIRAIGTGFQRVRDNYQGPVFAEGRGADYYWVGLNDGDYGKLPGFGHRLKPEKVRYPLLVDFRLKKLNPHAPAWGLNIGYSLFCGNPWFMTHDYSLLYHYLAMNIAFGTVGFIEPCGDVYPNPHTHFDKTLETYYLVRQLQKRYMMERVLKIRYFNGSRLVPTEEALVSGKYRDNMLYIRYENGLEMYINCNWEKKNWEITVDGKKYLLPPGGWFAKQGKELLEYSALLNGKRISYVDSPEYRYLNGYGRQVSVGGLSTKNIVIQYKTGKHAGKLLHYPENKVAQAKRK